jgi:hypothetical protein
MTGGIKMADETKVGFGEILKDGIDHYFKNIVTVVLIDLLSIVPMLFLSYYVQSKQIRGAGLLLALPVFFLMLTNVGSIYTIFNNSHKNEKTGFGEAFRAGVLKSFRVLCIYVIYGAIVLGGMLLLIVPGIIFMIKYAFMLIAGIVEDEKTSPLKVSAAISKKNAGLIIMIGLGTFLIFLLPNSIIYDAVKSNAVLFFVIMIPYRLLSTVSQSVLFSAYAGIRQARPEAVVPSDAKKPVNLAMGCLIGAVVVFVVVIALGIGVYSVVKNVGLDSFLKPIYGSNMVLSEKITIVTTDRWAFFPMSRGFRTYMMVNCKPEKEQGIIGVFVRTVPLSTEMTGAINGHSYDKDVARTIVSMEDRAGRTEEELYWDYKAIKESAAVKIGGNVWNRLTYDSVNNSAMTQWILYYLITDKDLMYFYFGHPEKADKELFEKDEQAIIAMFGK